MQAVATDRLRVTWATYAGLFVITMATLMYEILLTRIFSVTMWYHFAFVAISVAMFGLAVGGLLVYLFPKIFSAKRVSHYLTLTAWLFAVFSLLSFLAHIHVTVFLHEREMSQYSGAFNYLIIAVPFVFSGTCICLALTKFPQQVGRLYAVDLTGAAI